jgi:hypothetical protein
LERTAACNPARLPAVLAGLTGICDVNNHELGELGCQEDAADFFDSIGHEETIQGVSGDGSFPRKQPWLSLRYSLNR